MKKLVFILLVLVSVGAFGQAKWDTSGKTTITMYCGTRYSKIKPLFVIDGKATKDTLSLAKINPQHIESINVLKDSMATAIYGEAGKNGVIIVTTKEGKKQTNRRIDNSSLGQYNELRSPLERGRGVFVARRTHPCHNTA